MSVVSFHDAMVSSYKAVGDNEAIVRVYDASGLEDTVEIKFISKVKRAEKIDLLGNVMEGLMPEDNAVTIKLRANEIATIKVIF